MPNAEMFRPGNHPPSLSAGRLLPDGRPAVAEGLRPAPETAPVPDTDS